MNRIESQAPADRISSRMRPRSLSTHVRTVAVLAAAILSTTCDSSPSAPAGERTAAPPLNVRVVIEPSDVVVTAGSSMELQAFMEGQNGNRWQPSQGVVWLSENPEVATVSDAGLLEGHKPGTARIKVSVDNLSASTTASIEPDVAQLDLVTDAELAGTVGSPLQDSVGVRILDRNGEPVADVQVSFEVVSGEGTVSPATAFTTSTGIARTEWVLGPAAGVQELRISALGMDSRGTGGGGGQSASTTRSDELVVAATAAPSSPASISVSPSSLSLVTGEEAQLTARVNDAFGNPLPGTSVEWSTDDAEIATVSQDGIVEAVGTGQVTIRAHFGSHSASAEVAVDEPQRTLFKSAGDAQTGEVGSALSQKLRVHLADSAGAAVEGVPVTWSVATGGGSLDLTSMETNATGDAEVTWTLGTMAGTQSVTASSPGTDPVTFTATAQAGPVASVEVSPSSASLEVGGSTQLSAEAADEYDNVIADASIAWSSSDAAVASVDESGLVTGEGDGSATITATAGGHAADAQVTVSAPDDSPPADSPPDDSPPDDSPTTVSLSKTDGDGQTGTVGTALSNTLQVQVTDDSGGGVEGISVTWAPEGSTDGILSESSTDTDASGFAQVTWTLGTAAGSQSVTASAPDAGSVTFTATAEPGPVASLEVTPSSASLEVGGSTQLSAEAADEYDNVIADASIAWSSSDAAVASVDETGLVTGEGDGSATITATAGDHSADAQVTVSAPEESPTTVSLSKTDGDGQTGTVGTALANTLQVQVTDDSGAGVEGISVTWTPEGSTDGILSESSTVTDASGFAQVTWTLGTAAGSQSVTASAPDAGSVTFTATAGPGPVASLEVSPSSASLEVGGSAQLSAEAADEYDNVIADASIAWSSSDAAVASVDETGLVTGEGDGSATITATSDGHEGSASVTVSSSEPSDPGAVTDLSVVSTTDSSVVLSWTQVDDGTGSPAKYAIRYGSPTITWWEEFETEVTVTGDEIGAEFTFERTGLDPDTEYEFQMVSFRGTLNVDAVFGPLSNKAGGTTGSAPAGDDPDVASVTVSPESISFTALDETTSLSATAKDSDGNDLAGVDLAWESTNTGVASVDNGGNVVAVGNGTAFIIVTAVCCGVSDTASVSVDQEVASVEVSPSSVSISPGESEQLSATAMDANGFPLSNADFTWTSSDSAISTVSNSGLVTGEAAGSAIVYATASGASGSSSIDVGVSPNGGFADSFESGDLSKSEGGYAWGSTSSARVGVSNVRPRSGTYSLEITFAGDPDLSADAFEFQNFYLGEDLTEIWVEYYVWIPSNYFHRDADTSDNNKFFQVWGGNRSSTDKLWAAIELERGSQVDGNSRMRIIRDNNFDISRTIDNTGSVVTDSERGSWSQLRFHARIGTFDEKDGVMRVWWNGVLVSESSDVDLYQDPAGGGVNFFESGRIFGWSNSGYSEDTTFYVDDFKIFSSDPGW